MLLSIPQMPEVPGLRLPADVYFALADPAPLAGMAYPAAGMGWGDLHKVGLKQVVCLTGDAFPYDPAPLQPLLATRLEDLFDRDPPKDPAIESRKVLHAATVVARTIAGGQGVVVHCMGGTGRTGTVIGCALRLLGYPAPQVIDWLDRLNRERGEDGWPETAWQAEIVEGIRDGAAIHRPTRGGT